MCIEYGMCIACAWHVRSGVHGVCMWHLLGLHHFIHRRDGAVDLAARCCLSLSHVLELVGRVSVARGHGAHLKVHTHLVAAVDVAIKVRRHVRLFIDQLLQRAQAVVEVHALYTAPGGWGREQAAGTEVGSPFASPRRAASRGCEASSPRSECPLAA